MSSGLDVTIRRLGRGEVVVGLRGDLDTEGAEALLGKFQGVAAFESRIVALDMSGVTFLGSVGMALIIRLARDARAHGGEVVLVAVPEGIREALDMMRLGETFRLFDTVSEAVAE